MGGRIVFLLAFAATLLFIQGLWITRGELGIAWDEPPDIERQHIVARWFSRLSQPEERDAAFSASQLEQSWPFCKEAPHEHPPFSMLASLLTKTLFEPAFGELRACRWAPMLALATAAGALARFSYSRWGVLAALVSWIALVCNPRALGDAQLALTDPFVACCWLLASLAYLSAVETGRGSIWFGLWSALAVMSKATGVLVLPATFLWSVSARRVRLSPWLWAALWIPLVAFAMNPPWWLAPLEGPLRWGRAYLRYPQKIPVYYLGVVYDAKTTFVPWSQGLIVLGAMIPAGLLVLIMFSVVVFARPAESVSGRLSDRAIAWCAIAQMTPLLLLRAVGIAPAHDGLRQLEPILYFLPILAVIGARQVVGLLGRWGTMGRRLGHVLIAVALLEASVDTVRAHPYELEYFSRWVGGATGAHARGFETTYYWEVANQTVWRWMNDHLPVNATVFIAPPPDVRVFHQAQRWGLLRGDVHFEVLGTRAVADQWRELAEGPAHYLVLLEREGLIRPRPGSPATLLSRLAERPASVEFVPPALGVRVLSLYSSEDFRRFLADQPSRQGEDRHEKRFPSAQER